MTDRDTTHDSPVDGETPFAPNPPTLQEAAASASAEPAWEPPAPEAAFDPVEAAPQEPGTDAHHEHHDDGASLTWTGSEDVPEAEAAENHHAAAGVAIPLGANVPGAEWGTIDAEGNVRQIDTPRGEGRVIGKAKGRNPVATLAFFVDRFERLKAFADQLEREIAAAANKGRFSDRTARMIERVRSADALGDFDALLTRLEALELLVLGFQAEQKAKKEALCEQAEALRDSADWLGTTDKLKALQDEWKHLGSASREDDEALWARFRGALDEFFRRRDEDRTRRKEERSDARNKKEDICARAEAMVESTEWEQTAEAHARLMEEWKGAGWAGRGADEKLWERFSQARNAFFERRREARTLLRNEFDEGRKRREALCEAAEALIESQDVFGACEQAKQLQAEWKQAGRVPRGVSEELWQRFRAACDKLFERAGEERSRRRTDWKKTQDDGFSRRREQAESLRESIVRDVDHVERWRRAITGLGGDSAGLLRRGLEEKILGVEERLAEKRQRLQELEERMRQER